MTLAGDEVRAYIDKALRAAFEKALRCPACEAPTMCDDPDGSNRAWCMFCGFGYDLGRPVDPAAVAAHVVPTPKFSGILHHTHRKDTP